MSPQHYNNNSLCGDMQGNDAIGDTEIHLSMDVLPIDSCGRSKTTVQLHSRTCGEKQHSLPVLNMLACTHESCFQAAVQTTNTT